MKASLPAALTLSAICALAACAPEMRATNDSLEERVEVPRVSLELPRIVPIPDIPAALRGCWDSIPPLDPDEPGNPHRIVVTATTIEEVGDGPARNVATAEYVTRLTPRSIEGMFSAPDRFGRATIATALMLGDGGDDGPADHLTRREGDAGSSDYARCAEPR